MFKKSLLALKMSSSQKLADRLSASYLTLNGKNGAKIEIEAKYRSLFITPKGIILENRVSHESYLRVISYFNQRKYKSTIQRIHDELGANDIRRQTIRITDDNSKVLEPQGKTSDAPTGTKLDYETKTFIIKRIPQGFTLGETEFEQYGIKLSFQEEISLKNVDNTLFERGIISHRIKERISYQNINDVAQVDATIVTVIKNNIPEKHYEIELEFIPSTTASNNILASIQNFMSLIWVIKRIVDDVPASIPEYIKPTFPSSNNTNSDIELLFRGVNKILTGHGDFKPISNLATVTTMKFSDLKYGILIGNQHVDKNTGKLVGTRYNATWKVDGVRYLLVFLNDKIWLVQQNSPNPILVGQLELKDQRGDIINGTIIDGELVPMTARRNFGVSKPELWFIPFDIVATRGLLNIQSLSFFDRLNYIRQITKKIAIPYLEITIKQFAEILNVNDFYFQMRAMFAQEQELNYVTDGIIFTPVDAGYNPELMDVERWVYNPRGKPNESKNQPKILKWKPIITFDFKPQKTSLMYSSVGNLIPFVGDNINPFNAEVDQHGVIHNQGIQNNYVVEYKWLFPNDPEYIAKGYNKQFNIPDQNSSGLKYPNGLFVEMKLRPDKLYPNGKYTVLSNWKAVHDYLSKDVLIGHKNFELLFKYHNSIKRQLFDSRNGTLLDIGSGIGGDVKKWSKYSKVVAVEPDVEKIPELKRRISLLSPSQQSNILVVQTGGEDYKTITEAVNKHIGGKVDVVSMMLSMSFFWGNSSNLESLIKTIKDNIKPNGTFIYLTVDGAGVKKVYQQLQNSGYTTQPDLIIPPATLQLDEKSGVLKINIEGSKTVKNQTEYLVDLPQFYSLLGVDNQLKNVVRATEEKLLSVNEQIFTQMYSYGTIYFGSSLIGNQQIDYKNNVSVNNISFTPLDGTMKILEAILTAGSKTYRLSSRDKQIDYIKKLRLEISSLITNKNKDGINYWERFGDKLFTTFIDALVNDTKSDNPLRYSPTGIARLFNSKIESENTKALEFTDLDHRFIGIIGAILGVDIIVVSIDGSVINTSQNLSNNIIVLLAVGNRYQVLTVKDSYNNTDQSVVIHDPNSDIGRKLSSLLSPKISDYNNRFVTVAISKFKRGDGSYIPTDEDYLNANLLIKTSDSNIFIIDNYFRERVEKLKDKIINNPGYINMIAKPRRLLLN